MAIIVNSQPTGANFSKNELVFNLTSTNVNETQFSFVVDTYIGTLRVDRRFKQPNPVGRGVFDMQRIVDANLTPDFSALGATADSPGVDSSKTFTFRFGERYLDANDQVIIVEDLASSNALVALKGVQEYNTTALGVSTIPNKLSLLPTTNRVHRDDLLTVSYYDENTTRTIHTPISLPNTGSTFSQVVDGTTYSFTIYDTEAFLGERNFAWWNRTGGWEYFKADQEETKNTSVSKSSFDTTNISFGRSTSTNRVQGATRVFEGGTKNYAVEYGETYSKQTRWLDESEAERVSGIFDSPSVFLQSGTDWIPVQVSNGGYETLTTRRKAPLFNYNIQWRYSLDKRGY